MAQSSDKRSFVEARMCLFSTPSTLSDEEIDQLFPPLAAHAAREFIWKLFQLGFRLSQWGKEARIDGARISRLPPSRVEKLSVGALEPDPFDDIVEALWDPLQEFTTSTRDLHWASEFWPVLFDVSSTVAGQLSKTYDLIDSRFAALLERRREIQDESSDSEGDSERLQVEMESRVALHDAIESVLRFINTLAESMNTMEELCRTQLSELMSQHNIDAESEHQSEPEG